MLGHPLGPDSLADVYGELVDVSCKWYPIGLELGIRPGRLDTIKSDNPLDAAACLRETLHCWLKRVHPVPTWESLARALEGGTVEETHLAMHLRVKYCDMDHASGKYAIYC